MAHALDAQVVWCGVYFILFYFFETKRAQGPLHNRRQNTTQPKMQPQGPQKQAGERGKKGKH
jgi:hypothetical protein